MQIKQKYVDLHASGFTLIELLVGITVMTILIAVGWTNFVVANERQQLVAAGKQIAAELRLAQKRASSGEKPTDGACSSLPLLGYRVAGTAGESEMEVFVQCGVPPTVSTVSLGEIPIHASTAIQTSFSVRFNVLSRGVELTNPSLQLESIVLERDGLQQTYAVDITPTGEIRDVGLVNQE